jgi:hypothetical protein
MLKNIDAIELYLDFPQLKTPITAPNIIGK